MSIKITKRNVKPTPTQLAAYKMNKGVTRSKVPNLRFGKFAFATDADVDGSHISGLLINLFNYFWPELFEYGVINIFRTPLVKVTLKNKKVLDFNTMREFEHWAETEGKNLTGWSQKFYKGLGTSSTKDFTEYLSNLDNHMFRIDINDEADKDAINLAFNGDRADDRKVWLETPPANFEDFIL